jgi:TP901 family phage tail tape measure protein
LQQLDQSYQAVFKTLLSIPTASATAAISQEAAFAQVSRVVGDAEAKVNNLYSGLQKISTELPIDFEATAKIAQLGAQIGITADQLIQFTEVVAKFSVTTGITAETATILIGQIAEMENLPVTEFENFASAVLYLGTVSAATEQQILTINDSIATVGTVFGLSIQGVLGLSAAFATLRIRPELARGSLTRVFAQLQDAIDSSGHSLEVLGTLMGLTVQQVKDLKATDPDQFFLRFIQGLKNAADNGTSLRASLRDLGINAVRDIDTISRLASNFDVLSNAIGDSYAEYAKNTELTRQSQGIFNTTANRLSNLGDAFKNFLANAGKPLAQFVGALAKVTAQFLDFINAVPKAGYIIGGIATFLSLAVAAFVGYRLVLIKTLTTLTALREAQQQLGVTSVRLASVTEAWRQVQRGAAATTTQVVNTLDAEAVAARAAATSLTPVATATTEVAAANRALATTSTQAVASSRALNAAMVFNGNALNSSTISTQANTVAVTNNSTSRDAAVVAGTQLANTNVAVTTTQQAATVATEAGTVATTTASRTMRASALAAGPWITALTLVGTAVAFLLPALKHQKSDTEKLTQTAIDAAGGLGNLAKAIQDDTKAAKDGGPVYSEITVSVDDLSTSTKTAAENAIKNAKAQKDSIELIHGSVSELQKQAKGQGKTATAAKGYIQQINNANATIKSNTQLLKQNTVVLGDSAQHWLEMAFDAATSASEITKNADAFKLIQDSGLDLNKVLTEALQDPKKATDELDKSLAKIGETWKKTNGDIDFLTDSGKKNIEAIDDVKKFYDSLKGSIDAVGTSAAETALKEDLIGTKTAQTAVQAELAKKGFGDVALALQALGETADGSDVELTNLNETIQGFGTPLDAFSAAYDKAAEKAAKASKKTKDANQTAADSLTAFSDAGKVSLAEFEKQLDKIQDAMTNWAGNIVILAQRLGPDIAKYLENLGPTAAPLIQKLVDASDKELKKLKPKLEATTTDATTALSATILAAIPNIQGASKKTAQVISDAFVRQLQAGKVPFEDTVNQFAALVTALNSVKGKPKVELQTSDAKKSLTELKKLVLGTTQRGELSPEGQAKLSTYEYNQYLDSLKATVSKTNKDGTLDPEGQAKLSTYEYNQYLLTLKNDTKTKSQSGWFDPTGTAKLNTSTIYAQFATLKTNSDKTGDVIQANLTRSATVSVGYYYYQKNKPPKTPRYLEAADGGWVNGPGGPRDDMVPAMLSNREFVVNAAAAAQYAPLLEAINRLGGQGGGTAREVIAGAAVKAGVPAGSGVSVPTRAAALTSMQPGRPQTVIHVTNYYPQAEPTSKTVNRSLAFAAQLDGTL